MTIGLTVDHRDLRDSVRAFTSRHVTQDAVRVAVDADRDTLPPYWKALAAQGLLGLHLPESAGGSGYGLLELAVVAEELGRTVTPGPFLPTVLASAVLDRAGNRTRLAGLADGTLTGAVGLAPGTLTLTRSADGEATLSGESELVVGGHVADLLVLAVRDEAALGEGAGAGDGEGAGAEEHRRGDGRGHGDGPRDGEGAAWVVVPRTSVTATDLRSHDLTRRSSRIRADRVPVPDGDLLDVAPGMPLDLAAALYAAEASGIADWATATAADHARIREQFGRPIGQFQGVKHRCARMFAHAERARACAWDAARALERGAVDDPREASLAAAVAGATSVAAAFTTVKDCVQVLGGIGFTWEHDAHLYLRRAQTLRLTLGPTARWHRRVARLTLEGVRRRLDVELPPEAEAVREGIRTELASAAALGGAERSAFLADHGYTAPHLPAPWGRGADAATQLVVAEELDAAGLTPVDMVIGGWVVPTLIAHGSEEQRERFLRPSLRGEITWCQLFSEPGAGSDLAGLTTRAEKVEGGWRVSGQKVWTSGAHEAQWGILLARTDPSVPKHKGVSYFLLDMAAPGIDIRPLRQITGEAEFNEIFLDGVFVPDDALVGAPGEGWKLARTTLANERVALSHDSSLGSGGEALLEIAAARPEEMDHARLTTLGAILGDAQSGGLLGLRTTLRSVAGHQPGAEASIAKLSGVEHLQEVWETAVEWQGTSALTGEGPRQDATWWFLNSRCMSIAGGTTEVQLNIIGERLLGLPRDPAPAPKSA